MTKRAWGATIQNREEKFELKRRAVLQSAARLIQRVGFDALSLGDIAADLNVAKPTIYYYFRNKEEIVRELMGMAVTTFLDETDHPEDNPLQPGLSGADAFERLIRRAVRVTSDDVGSCLFVVYPNQLQAELRRDMEAMGQPVITWADRVVRQGIADGSMKPCDPIVIYNFMINGLRAVPILVEMHRGTPETLADTMVALLAHGIRAAR